MRSVVLGSGFLRLGIGAICVAMLFGSTVANATATTFTLSDATATFDVNPPGIGSFSLTGTFTFDPSAPSTATYDITATGAAPPLSQSPELFDKNNNCGKFCPGHIIGMTGNAGDMLFIVFQDDLGSIADTITEIGLATPNIDVHYTQTVTGTAEPSTAVPEPSSMAIFGGGLAAAGLLSGRRKRPA